MPETDKPETFERCVCGADTYIPAGEDWGYCFNEYCGFDRVRRPTAMVGYSPDLNALVVLPSDERSDNQQHH